MSQSSWVTGNQACFWLQASKDNRHRAAARAHCFSFRSAKTMACAGTMDEVAFRGDYNSKPGSYQLSAVSVVKRRDVAPPTSSTSVAFQAVDAAVPRLYAVTPVGV